MTSQDLHDRFLRLLGEHQAILFRIASNWTRQAEDRHDLVQEMVLQCWRSFPRFDDRSKFSTWLYRIGLNVAISRQRKERTRQRHTPVLGCVIEVASAPAQEPPAEVERLRQCIAWLPDLDRALMLLYLDGNDHATIAQVLGLTATNVGTKISRLRQRLEDSLRRAAANDKE